jgi:hypothetical protein
MSILPCRPGTQTKSITIGHLVTVPVPLGRNFFPSKRSSTELLPELFINRKRVYDLNKLDISKYNFYLRANNYNFW